jgi:hypothetical protein
MRTAMKRLTVENTFRWLLAAWMLVATSVASSTYMHSHSGGSLAHQHDEYDHAASHPVMPVPVHGDHDGHDHDIVSLSAVDVHRHGFLAMLGTITYQSVPDGSSGSSERQPYGWDTIVAVSAVQGVRAMSKSVASDHCSLAAPTVLAIGCVCEVKQPALSCADTAPVSPLCDRARHERSGVLLA